jgi:hypothetical protein
MPITLTMALLLKLKGLEYRAEEAVGSVPSVVYRIVAPEVVVDNVTWGAAEVKLPPFGVIVGIATVGVVMVNAALAIPLLFMPLLTAMALTVLFEVTLNAAEYWAEDVVGSVPLVV